MRIQPSLIIRLGSWKRGGPFLKSGNGLEMAVHSGSSTKLPRTINSHVFSKLHPKLQNNSLDLTWKNRRTKNTNLKLDCSDEKLSRTLWPNKPWTRFSVICNPPTHNLEVVVQIWITIPRKIFKFLIKRKKYKPIHKDNDVYRRDIE